MRFNATKRSFFSLVLTWSTLILLSLTASRFNVVHEVFSSNHIDENEFEDECRHHDSPCELSIGKIINYKHTHKTSDNKEHEHTHVLHVHVVYVPSLTAQPIQILKVPTQEYFRVSAIPPEHFILPKESYTTIFRPPIA